MNTHTDTRSRLDLIRERSNAAKLIRARAAAQPRRGRKGMKINQPRKYANRAEGEKARRARAALRGMCSLCATAPARENRKTCQGCVAAELRRRRARGHR
jgi:hypothetical protein